MAGLAGVEEGRRVFTMSDPEAACFDLLSDYGLMVTLDGLATVCRTVSKWHREDGEPKHAVKFERLAEALHKLSLKAETV